MTLGELLETLRRDMLHDRSDQVAGDDDHLWSDSTLIHYINQAQRRFSRRSLCIRDGTSALTRFMTVALKKEYILDPSIVAVVSARNLGNGGYVDGVYVQGDVDWTTDPPTVTPGGLPAVQPQAGDLARAGHNQFDVFAIPSRSVFDVNSLGYQQPGNPLAYDTDEYTTADVKGRVGSINMRLYPLPSVEYANQTIQLRVCRTAVKLTDLTVEAEIPEDYHLAMLDYAAYLALRIVDHELGDPVRAGEFLTSFEAHVAECRVEMLRRMFTPMVWGFGRNGFGYVQN